MRAQCFIILLLGTACAAPPPSLNESLRAAAARRGVYMGAQFKGALIDSDPNYTALHTEQYSLSTVGNQCKWTATEATEGEFNLTACNAAFGYARRAKQAFRGHNLCWGNNNPQWLLQKTGAAELRGALRAHVTAVMQGVKAAAGGVSPLAWDVVNEAANGTAWFKPNTWYPALQDYVDVAFSAARAADNSTQLFYNDYDILGGGAKAEQVHGMVASMVQRGIPIDGVGMQAHLALPRRYWSEGASWTVEGAEEAEGARRTPAPTAAAIAANIARFGQLGLKVHITEMDVSCPSPCADDALAAQAQVYEDVLRGCLAHPAVCRSFETWGFTDKDTWLDWLVTRS